MLNRKKKLDSYICFLEDILLDKSALKKIKRFFEKGMIILDGNNLYGKIVDSNGNDYIEIKYDNDLFSCNYTEWNGETVVNIRQKNIDNNFIRFNKRINDDNRNIEFEKIYNSDKNLIYQSDLRYADDINLLDNKMIYKDNIYTNYLELNRIWYMPNGSIIKYNLCRKYIGSESKLEENYSICPSPCYDNGDLKYNYSELNETLFKNFMTGKITIDELLSKKEEKIKIK